MVTKKARAETVSFLISISAPRLMSLLGKKKQQDKLLSEKIIRIQ